MDSAASKEVEEHSLDIVLAMMAYGDGFGAKFLSKSFKFSVTQVATRHFKGNPPGAGNLARVKAFQDEFCPESGGYLFRKKGVAVGFLASESEMAMHGYALVAQRHHYGQ